jgi:hypothetical protein
MEKKIFIDNQLSDYANLFTGPDAKKIIDLLDSKSDYYPILFNFTADLRSISNSHSFPFYSIQAVEGYDKGYQSVYMKKEDAAFYSDKLVGMAIERIEKHGKLPKQIRPLLIKEFKEIGKKIEIARKKANEIHKFPTDELWEDNLKQYEYRTAIWSMVRICFMSIFSTYEYFIVDIVRKKLGDDSIRTTDRDFDNKFKTALDARLLSRAWKSADMQFIREVRNCIAHNGGIPSEKLKTWKGRIYEVNSNNYRVDSHTVKGDNVPLCDGQIQITPIVNKWMIGLLCESVKQIASKVASYS